MTSSRLASGGRIDRTAPIRATFDGRPLDAFEGDTLASAMLASGIAVAGHSVVLGRPRGITSAGSEEPTGIIQVDKPFPEPMLLAPVVELVDGLAASSLNGQGRLDPGTDPAAYDAIHHHCEVAVVGAGPAGLAAALTAGLTGVRVLLLDERPEPGGSLLTDHEIAWATELIAKIAQLPNVVVRQRTTVTGYYDENYLIAVERRMGHTQILGADPEHTPIPVRERIWRIRAAEVVLATGAHERPIVFAGNDIPGVMLAESVRAYLHRYGVLAGDRIAIFTTNDGGYRVAGELMAVGAEVFLIDPRGEPKGEVPLPVPTGTVLTASIVTGTIANADGSLSGVTVRSADGIVIDIPADLLTVSGGWNPAVQLFSQAGGKLAFDEAIGSFVPTTCRQHVTVAGAAGGLFSTAEAVDDGIRAGAAAAEAAGEPEELIAAAMHEYTRAGVPDLSAPDDGLGEYPEPAVALYLAAPPGQDPATMTSHFVDVHRDVTVADIARATGAGLAGVEHVKRYTTAGTAHDQGKTSGLLTTAITAAVLGVEPGDLGTTTYRPPYTPIGFAALAGRERGDLYDPIRTTGAHHWDQVHGAEFENVGQWKRPWFYPQPLGDGTLETMDAAVRRECAAARGNVAFMDGSTLGKIEVRGPDAPAFLDLLYTNLMSTLKIGSIRYGAMCGVDGMIIDDGTVLRLAPDRYLLTTTTGNAAKILDWMEEWLQTEWPHLTVWCTSVTEQWATMALVGPNSRQLLGSLAPELDVDNDAFGFMTFRETAVAGLPARVCRISFSGELAYEINVPWFDAAALWDAVWRKGSPIGLTPYGTETMHVLRAEKGYPIIGQDTDGTITPQDLGMGWVVSKKKLDFIGKRSHARPDNLRPDRKHLVGLLPVDPDLLLSEGSQLVADAELPAPPVPMLGHVTSSYYSVELGRTFALALLIGGRDLIGEVVHVVVAGVPQPVTVAGPVLVDPDGAFRDGRPQAPAASDASGLSQASAEPPASAGSLQSPESLVSAGPQTSAGPEAAAHTPAGLDTRLPVSPLSDYSARFAALFSKPGARVLIAEEPLTTAINVRVKRGSVAVQAISDALNCPFPHSTGQIGRGDLLNILALGPDEFLVTSGPGHAEQIIAAIDTASAGEPVAVTDVSATRTLIRITGPHARTVLAHGCAIDLGRLKDGECAQTLLAQCAVIIFSDGPPGTQDDLVKVYVRSSFAAHLAQWLLLTAPEYV